MQGVSALPCSRNYDLRSIAMRIFRSELPGAWASQNLKDLPQPRTFFFPLRFIDTFCMIFSLLSGKQVVIRTSPGRPRMRA
jgi:hypothetical protein